VNSSLTDALLSHDTTTSHTHHVIPGSPAKPPLVLLHGSGGDEHELVPLAADLAPGSPVLAVRGGIPFDDGYAFFHRFPDRSIDEADITSRAAILADFIGACTGRRQNPSLKRPGGPAAPE
jgi:phospholipase/carboxylesterase